MPRKKTVEEIAETEKELVEVLEVVEPYELEVPCQFVVEAKKFDKAKMANYTYIEVGRYWKGSEEMLVLDVK